MVESNDESPFLSELSSDERMVERNDESSFLSILTFDQKMAKTAFSDGNNILPIKLLQ
jgi:hypothetical protein